jgi:glycerate dehydrogenase
MEHIVFLDRGTLRARLRRPAFAHTWREYDETGASAEVVERLREATIAVTNKVPLRRDALSQLPCLRLIAVAATGTDVIDLDDARERRIAVSNVRNYARTTVPEHVFTLALALSRQLISYREDLRRGSWERAPHFSLLTYPVRDLSGRTLGIIGYGALGQSVAALGRAFGMELLIAERKGARGAREGRTPFVEVLRRADILTLHAPLTEETRRMIGREELLEMKRDALLINCARGGLVDEASLVEALRAGEIAGAGVDVLSAEPPRGGNPLLEADLPNLIVTPHIAWASLEAMQALADQLIDNIEAFVRGEARNLVTSGEQTSDGRNPKG